MTISTGTAKVSYSMGFEPLFKVQNTGSYLSKAIAGLAFLACHGSVSHAQELLPVWPEWAGGQLEVVAGLSSEGTTNALVVRDGEGRSFVCRLQRSRSFAGIRELADCEPIVAHIEAESQSERNLQTIADYLLENIPNDICGEDISALYEMVFLRFDEERFSAEFVGWNARLTNGLVHEAVAAINGVIVIDRRWRDEKVWVDGRMIRSEFRDKLDEITFIYQGERVLFEDACH